MKKTVLWMIAAILICGTTVTTLTSCKDDDETSVQVNNPVGTDLYKTWLTYKELVGPISGHDYGYYVGQAATFREDGTGTWYFFLLNSEKKPVYVMGGKNRELGAFHYSVNNAGEISLKLDNAPDYDWTLNYRDGKLIAPETPLIVKLQAGIDLIEKAVNGTTRAGEGESTVALNPANEWDSYILEQLDLYGEETTYNVNDRVFNATNWRQQDAIVLFDAKGKVKDERGYEGYTIVPLPWAKSRVQSNLPLDFCDDIIPENGWELAMNMFGDRTYANDNYFALYNKYTGTLRYFFYMPQEFSAGNDHVWQIAMSDGLANRYDMRYGVPNDKTVADKEPFGMTPSGNGWIDYVTPYVADMQDGLIVPAPGWWAFDVDLSLYRTDGLDLSDEMIGTQMRSWNTQHISLQSALIASTEGKMDAQFDLTKTCVKKSKGFFGKIGSIVKAGSNLVKTVKSVASGDIKGTVKNGVEFGKSAANVKTTFTQKDQTYVDTLANGKLTGTISLNTNGNIDTEGIIKGAFPTTGIIGPRLFIGNDFHSESHVGQGVWNLKTSPVVYRTNGYIENPDGIDNPVSSTDGRAKRSSVQFMLFDPSSVEVEFNPEVFPEDQIEWIQVDAVCGLRNEVKWEGTDGCRDALGLSKRGYYILSQGKSLGTFGNATQYADFLNWSNEKYDFTYPAINEWLHLPEMTYIGNTTYNQEVSMLAFGRGDEEYLIEPQPNVTNFRTGYGLDAATWSPAYEINVTVAVKLRDFDAPFVYNRIYLPEIVSLNVTKASNLQTIYDRYNNKLQDPKIRVTDYNKYQLWRLMKVFGAMKVGFEDTTAYSVTVTSATNTNYITGSTAATNLFDYDVSTSWPVLISDKDASGKWYVEFETNKPITPESYSLRSNYSRWLPTRWKLFAAKQGDKGNWQLIHDSSNDNTFNSDGQVCLFTSNKLGGQTWKYFRLDVFESINNEYMSISDFWFNFY